MKIKKLKNNIDKALDKITSQMTGRVHAEILYQNAHIQIVSKTCGICYNSKEKATLEDKADYIERRIASGHESILEHSNIIMKITFGKTDENLVNLAYFLPLCKYLNVKVNEIKDRIELIVGGSIRGFKHVVRNNNISGNKIVYSIINCMYELHSCYFGDFIRDNIMIKQKFLDTIEEDPVNTDLNKHVNILAADNIKKLQLKLGVSKNDILDLATITVLFKGVSRTASHQLVRHRNGITQLSQRYTDSSNLEFVDPIKFKPDKYDIDKKYNINILDGDYTSQELGDTLMSIYNDVLEEGMLKEDARSFLPSNVETSLYMTFTFRSLLQFLHLRTDKAAQAEIRALALELEDIIQNNYPSYLDYELLEPRYNEIGRELEDISSIIDEPME